jgi:hypothetical protein
MVKEVALFIVTILNRNVSIPKFTEVSFSRMSEVQNKEDDIGLFP